MIKTLSAAFAALLIVGSAQAFAKAHDQGVADGTTITDNTGAFVQTLDKGVSSLQNKGKRGDISSTQKGDGRVEPVVGNGANATN